MADFKLNDEAARQERIKVLKESRFYQVAIENGYDVMGYTVCSGCCPGDPRTFIIVLSCKTCQKRSAIDVKYSFDLDHDPFSGVQDALVAQLVPCCGVSKVEAKRWKEADDAITYGG